MLKTISAGAMAFVALTAVANASVQDLTSDFFNGSGNTNAGFYVSQNEGVELGLRAHQRFPTPQNIFNNDDADNVYGPFEAQGYAGTNNPGGPRASWNFNWSINVDWNDSTNKTLSALTYLIEIDYDPSAGTNFLSFDPLNTAISVDHSFGNNGTTSATDTVGDGVNNAILMLDPNVNIAQNSWQLNFFSSIAPQAFDPNAIGIYDIRLSALDGTRVVTSTSIQVLVGAVPEATAVLTWAGLALCGSAFAWRAKRRQLAA